MLEGSYLLAGLVIPPEELAEVGREQITLIFGDDNAASATWTQISSGWMDGVIREIRIPKK